MERPTDPYAVLGLERGAALPEVKRAYRRLVKESHPDAAGDRGADRFMTVHAAYQAIVTAQAGPLPQPRGRGPQRASWQPARRRPWRGTASARGPRTSEAGPRSEAEEAARRTARLGSTSYDDAPEFEPEWSGSSWYGETSGTYWVVNPREYADPRKHGPEYLARGRRLPDELPEVGDS